MFKEEPESFELRRFIGERPRVASAAIARVEVVRALRRSGESEAALERAEAYFGRVLLRRQTGEILDRAAQLGPSTLRTLDALHLATALDFAPPPGLFLCYDQRLADAARAYGLAVFAPGLDEIHEP